MARIETRASSAAAAASTITFRSNHGTSGSSAAASSSARIRFLSETTNSPGAFRPKRPRNRTTPEQLAQLEALYNANPSPTVPIKAVLAKKLGMELKVVNIWFQNKRQTMKKRLSEASNGDNEKARLGSARSVDSSGKPSRIDRPVRNTRPPPKYRASREESIDIMDEDSDDPDETEDEMMIDSPRKKLALRSASDILDHMAPSSPMTPSVGKQRAAILLKYGTKNKLEWACAKASSAGRFSTLNDRENAEAVGNDGHPASPSLTSDSGYESESPDGELTTPVMDGPAPTFVQLGSHEGDSCQECLCPWTKQGYSYAEVAAAKILLSFTFDKTPVAEEAHE